MKHSPRDWTELELLRHLLAHEPRAWRQLETRYRRVMQRCIAKVLGRGHAAEVDEVYAEVLAGLIRDDMRKLRLWDPARGTRLGSWLGLLSKNAARDHVRSHAARRATDADDLHHLPSPDHGPLEELLASEWRARVSDAVAACSERDREFLTLYFGRRLTVEELAAEMSISVKTVYTKKHKLLARLAAQLHRPA